MTNISEQLNGGFEHAENNKPQEDLKEQTVPTEDENNTEDSQEQEIGFFQGLTQHLGHELEDFSKYTEDEQGIFNYVSDYGNTIKEQAAAQVEQQIVENLQQQVPMLFDLMNRALQGVPEQDLINEYYGVLNFENTNFESLTEEDHRAIVRKYQLGDTFSEEDAQAFLDTMKDRGTLAATAKKLHEAQFTAQKAKYDALLEARQQQEAQLNNIIAQQAQATAQLIQAKQLESITIPEKDIKPFMEYLDANLDHDAEGNLYIKQYLGNKKGIQNAFINFRGGDVSDLLQYKINSQVAQQIFKGKKSGTPNAADDGKKKDFDLFGHVKL